jgi:signal peptidase II
MPSTYQYPPTEFDSKPRSYRWFLFLIAAAVVVLDRFSKVIIGQRIAPGEAHTIIPGVLRITHVLNTGAAFSMFAESASPLAVRNALIVFSIAAVLMVSVMLWQVGRHFSLTAVALALILGGAFGNLYDRVRYSSVLDFIEVHIIHYHWPDFNVADSCIVIGACLLLIEIFRPQPTD